MLNGLVCVETAIVSVPAVMQCYNNACENAFVQCHHVCMYEPAHNPSVNVTHLLI